MNELLDKAIKAHGGMDRWNRFSQVTTTMVSGGKLVTMQGFPLNPTPRQMTVWLQEQRSSNRPFGSSPDQYTDFTPTRIAILKDSGELVAERKGTSRELHDQMEKGPWGLLGLATFNGYAMWNYMTTPFFLTMPGFEVEEISPYNERGQLWRVLQVRFPDTIMGHSTVQQYYFDDSFLLRRLDYAVTIKVQEKQVLDIAQYVYDIRDIQGIKVPTTRRMYLRGADLRPIVDELIIWIDLSDIRYK